MGDALLMEQLFALKSTRKDSFTRLKMLPGSEKGRLCTSTPT